MSGLSWTGMTGNRRRRHKNSKLGCPNCKKRRVKCSEDLPSCKNCIKHNVVCGYLQYSQEKLDEVRMATGQTKAVARGDSVGSDVRDGSWSSQGGATRNPSSDMPLKKGSGGYVEEAEDDTDGKSDDGREEGVKVRGVGDSSHHGVNSVLNFQQHGVTQDFDNLLSTDPAAQSSIIYPVYSIAQKLRQEDMVRLIPDPNFVPSRDVFNAGAFDAHMDTDWKIDLFDAKEPVKTEMTHLPNAIISTYTFELIEHDNRDYEEELAEYLRSVQHNVSEGKTTLPQIRLLFIHWLLSFIYKSYHSSVMMSCLLNLTTNYLITNCFNSSYSNFVHMVDTTKTKNHLIVASVQHYAKVIKGLRELLNRNEDPMLCFSVSYILSSMAIYDPEATIYSSNCYRDGVFSVLSHNIDSAKKDLVFLPVYLRLLTNIQRSVYLPAYDPHFLHDIRFQLAEFGKILPDIADYSQKNIMTFVKEKHTELMQFANYAIDNCVPKINENLSNLDVQKQIIFDMMYKWVRLVPSRLLISARRSDPFEKVLYLFFKAFKKALYAVLPQSKYFFLRDFDSPLMLDVIDIIDDYEIYDQHIDHPVSYYIPQHAYDSVKLHLKHFCGYLIRVLQFLKLRLMKLYAGLVTPKVVENLRIADVAKWELAISGVKEARNQYIGILGASETPIKSFTTTLIKEHHYPRFETPSTTQTDSQDEESHPNFLTLRRDCFLADDYRPDSQV